MKRLVFVLAVVSFISCKEEEKLPDPVASFTYFPQANLTAPVTVTFQSTSTNAHSQKWFIAGNEVSTQKSVTYAFPRAGYYQVTLVVYRKSNYSGEILWGDSAYTGFQVK